MMKNHSNTTISILCLMKWNYIFIPKCKELTSTTYCTEFPSFHLKKKFTTLICYLLRIPSANILKLETHPVTKKSKPAAHSAQTFGANIHDLLANDFFLENGFMGEFAKKKINEAIRFLNVHSIWARLKKIDENTGDKDKSADREQLITELVLWKVIKPDEQVLPEEQAQTDVKPVQIELPSLSEIDQLIQEQHFMDQKAYRKIIEVIGEPILRYKLLATYEDIFGREEDEKMKQLRILAEELNYNLIKK
jgi:hypothetical protein